ncbi:MAG: hypothetical protein HQL72_08520 [Magnetococcales bacterium]|nr:hypothetical protein [Magnetococcales bacterium]
MARIKRLLLVGGRQLRENFHRDLVIKEALEARGVETRYGVASRQLNKNGYDESARALLRQPQETIWLESPADFKRCMRGFDAVVFGAWKSYLPLVQMARAEGRMTFNYNDNGGGDHWPMDVDHALMRSAWQKRLLLHLQEKLNLRGALPPERMHVTGSIVHEFPQGTKGTVFADRDRFCAAYGMDPEKPIACLFPKGIAVFKQKVRLWFPHWSESQQTGYDRWVLDKYAEICRKMSQGECNTLIKMHPTSYSSYMCNRDEESAYWQQFPWLKVLAPEHTYDLFHYADIGIAITSHAAIDMGYFGKPVIYVDSDQLTPPPLPSFQTLHLSHIPLGPSSHWHSRPREDNLWFPSWLGHFARAKDLPDLLKDPQTYRVSPADHQRFVSEFWYKKDGRSGDRMAEFILRRGEERLSSLSHQLSLPRLRGVSQDLLHRLASSSDGR